MEESTFLNPSRTLAAAGLVEGMRVADFGASAGFFARAAARLVGGYARQNDGQAEAGGGVVWAVDQSGELLSRLKSVALAERLHNVEVLRGDPSRADGTALPAGSFDFVFAVNILFTLEDSAGLAAEALRVLKPRGRVLVVDWRGTFGGLGPAPEHLVTIGRARDAFEAAGFSFVGDVLAGEYHWGFVARKMPQNAHNRG